ncbi:hypothetical protein [Pelagerythrobacter marinus]|uniref:hypothetical protein n=1 Tax=Pelagerythrobacter marinus TaxID=538382 RepID=UPI002AC8B221|nr:hypothetical protein [Pelagerythrobacter marinus]WPZ05502.1 hypothetical protein T8T98_08655 [Pelagerythrobacter marinus]
MIYELIAFGGIVFWTIVAAALLATLLFLKGFAEGDRIGTAIGCTVIFGGFLFAFSDFPSIDLQSAAIGLGAYIAIALVWASARWFFFLRKIRDFVLNNKEMSRTKIDSELAYKFDTRSFPPTASEHSGRLWFWSMYWPLDMLAETLTGPLNWIYDHFVLVFSSISRRVFSGVTLPPREGGPGL